MFISLYRLYYIIITLKYHIAVSVKNIVKIMGKFKIKPQKRRTQLEIVPKEQEEVPLPETRKSEDEIPRKVCFVNIHTVLYLFFKLIHN